MHTRWNWILLILAGLVFTTAAEAQDNKTAYTDPANADKDFAFQGEYLGEKQFESEKKTVGLQVIALGDGKFRVVGYIGGLPGAGWDGEEKYQRDAVRSGDEVKIAAKELEATIKDGKVIFTQDGKPIGQAKKVDRKSPTLGKKPPEGAVVLFDGTTAENFKGGRLSDEGYLMQGVTSKQTFGDQMVHVEFLLPYMPYARGQGRGNSGCYLQGRYEVQMLDSFGLEGKNNECGGIYSVKAPDVNMCLPPLSWQTYDIDFTAAKYEDGKKTANARMTVRHNGVVIHDDVEIPGSTRAAPVKEGPQPGPLYLQNHGNPVRYRNIWVVEK